MLHLVQILCQYLLNWDIKMSDLGLWGLLTHLHSLMLLAEYPGSDPVRGGPACPGDSNYGPCTNLELPDSQGQQEKTNWGVPLGRLFHFEQEHCTLSIEGKLFLNFRIHLGNVLTPALGTTYTHSILPTFFCIFFTSYKTESSLGGALLHTVLNAKRDHHLCYGTLGRFSFSGWDSI